MVDSRPGNQQLDAFSCWRTKLPGLPAVVVTWINYYSGKKEGLVAPTSWNFRRERLLARAGSRVKEVASGKGKKAVTPDSGVARVDRLEKNPTALQSVTDLHGAKQSNAIVTSHRVPMQSLPDQRDNKVDFLDRGAIAERFRC